MIEQVDGTIIGEFTYPFEFWTRDGKRQIASGFFANDDEAIEHFKSHYPDWFRQGVEMRRYE